MEAGLRLCRSGVHSAGGGRKLLCNAVQCALLPQRSDGQGPQPRDLIRYTLCGIAISVEESRLPGRQEPVVVARHLIDGTAQALQRDTGIMTGLDVGEAARQAACREQANGSAGTQGQEDESDNEDGAVEPVRAGGRGSAHSRRRVRRMHASRYGAASSFRECAIQADLRYVAQN